MAKSILLDMLPFQHSGGFGGALSFTKAVYDCLFKLYMIVCLSIKQMKPWYMACMIQIVG